jgi:microcystin-dependent protein
MLFHRIGNTFGGDGTTTFGVPNLTSVAPKNCDYCISTSGEFSTDYYEGVVGETFQLPTSTPEVQNLLECNGQPISDHIFQLLAIYIGTRFGGTPNLPNLPNLSGKAINGYRYVISARGDSPDFPDRRNPRVGELILLPYDQQTERLLVCNGAMLPVRGNEALFSVIGNRFGGNSQQFALPDLRAAVPANYSYHIANTGTLPTRP